MRAQLESVIEELKSLRSEGVEGVYLEDVTLARLREMAKTIAPVVETPRVAESAPATSTASYKSEPHVNLLANWQNELEAADKASLKPESEAKATKAKPTADALPEGISPIPTPRPFQLVDGNKKTRWEALRDVVLGDPVCQEHAQLDRGNRVVFGVGSLDADIFFCGEAPGADEALQGEPFVGKAGQLLTKIIRAMGLSREKVYIGNIMNWRPEHDKPYGNRPPTDEEMAYCLPYLQAQVDIIQPKVIVALGGTAAKGLLGLEETPSIGKTRGQWLDYKGRPLIVTYHPSFLLRNASDASKRLVWEDMLKAMEKIKLPISEKQRGYFLPKS